MNASRVLSRLVLAISVTALATGSAQAEMETPAVDGSIFCDANQNGEYDPGDFRLPNVRVIITNEDTDEVVAAPLTDADGEFWVGPLDHATYFITLDPSTLPADAVVTPEKVIFNVTNDGQFFLFNFAIDSASCRDEGACWLTGGGVKFSTIAGDWLAERGPKDSLGGNVFPSCSPDPGDGGNWNHVSHSAKLHFLGRTIETVECGNVPDIEPGSESPVTPFNYIEFMGTGTIKGIKGNKFPSTPVSFFARAEDRNEPGSNGAKDGADIDRYFLHVFDTGGNTLLLVDMDGQAATVDPILITGGNLQLHVSSCDDPPPAN